MADRDLHGHLKALAEGKIATCEVHLAGGMSLTVDKVEVKDSNLRFHVVYSISPGGWKDPEPAEYVVKASAILATAVKS